MLFYPAAAGLLFQRIVLLGYDLRDLIR